MIKFKLLFSLLFIVSCAGLEPLFIDDISVQTDKNTQVEKDSLSTKHKTQTLPAENKLNPIALRPVKLKIEELPNIELNEKLSKYCDKIDLYFKKYRWGESHCRKYDWHHVRNSYLGTPIVWHTFGKEKAEAGEQLNTTLILCGVHGDEITPVKFCFDLLKDLTEHPEVAEGNRVVVAPLVTPDSFLKKYPTRTNARGVDINRNFPTKDWNKNAIKLWKRRYKSDKRRFPGTSPRSEHETVFQINLIKLYSPQKIISVHAPLTLLDYDGPEHGHAAGKQLLIQMSDKAGKYKINNYPFFTGSLGNWAGNERKIATYTLELPNSDWTKTSRFFNTFRTAIHHAIVHNFTEKVEVKQKVTKKLKESKDNDSVL